MKTNWEYIIEDIQKSVIKNRNAAIREGKREGKMEGRKEGLLEGEKIGKLNGFLEIAQNMIRGGETSDKITLYTGFSKSKIDKMKREMNA